MDDQIKISPWDIGALETVATGCLLVSTPIAAGMGA